jgi:methionine synthase II (cobalamin-independent)
MDLTEVWQGVFSLDIPYLPIFPQADPKEEMLQQLGGSPPKALGEFLKQLEQAKPKWVKLQWPGPHTLAMTGVENFRERARRMEQFIFNLVHPVQKLCPNVLFFFDEPGLSVLDMHQGHQKEGMEDLKLWTKELKEEGVTVGVHCCSDAPWGPLLKLPLDVIAFDAELSLVSILKEKTALKKWAKKGGHLAIGIVPTLLSADWNAAERARVVQQAAAQFLGKKAGQEILRSALLTPACGLGLRAPEGARQVFSELKMVQGILREELE